MVTRWPAEAELYLDHNGSTPLHPQVIAACQPFLTGTFANPSAGHPAGQAARAAVDAAREVVARVLGAREEEIVVTSGGSEANNHALLGVFTSRARGSSGLRGHLVVSAIEHKSVLATAAWLEERGVAVTRVAPRASGAVEASDVERALRPDTALVSVMLANNETGVLQPIEAIAGVTRARGVALHVDAVAALGKVPVDVARLGCDLLSVAGHKLYAPKGCGVLWIRGGLSIEPLVHGCGQQRGQRGGTENALALVGFARALELLASGELGANDIAVSRDALLARILELVPAARRNGDGPSLPNTVNVWFPGRPAHVLQAELGRRGIAVSAGAAAAGASGSHVLLAMGASPDRARESLRFSFGLANGARSVERTVEVLAEILKVVPEVAR